MIVNAARLSPREKAIVVGLFLSQYDEYGVHYLGFEKFSTVYNVFGIALGVNPKSIKNYRDEFDPLFSNKRRGRVRVIRAYCLDIYERFTATPFPEFVDLLRSLVYSNPSVEKIVEQLDLLTTMQSGSFAKRLITGVAAECYFREHYSSLPIFDNHALEDTTALGCGFDFRMVSASETFFGVEVKGLNEPAGTISLTEKEYRVAQLLGDAYCLFVVKNFRDRPFHELVRNPLASHLHFRPREMNVTAINWSATV